MSDKENALTHKQEAFASAYVETGVGAEAYRRAYDVAPDATFDWVHVEACKLLDNPKVAQRVAELQKELADLRRFTRLKAMEELDEARAIAIVEKQSSAAIKATEVKIKMLGLDAPMRHELTGKGGGPIQTQDVSDDADAFARRMARLAASADESGDGEPDAGSEGGS